LWGHLWRAGLLSAFNAKKQNLSAAVRNIAASAKARNKSICALMASTIARIAAKPATSRWPSLVSTDQKHIELILDADPRFAAAAAGGARYLGESGGLTTEAAGKFQSAVLFACEEAFAHLDLLHMHVQITLNQFTDRIEVLIVHQADAPSVGLHTLLNAGVNPMEGVDRVQYEQLDGSSVTRLTKFVAPRQ
jgi:hypothetical protein